MYTNLKKFSSSIILCGSFFLLVGCSAIGLPDLTRHDEVPDEVKALPRQVSIPTEDEGQGWPRLGDIPSKPKDFPTPTVYKQHMEEMEFHRSEAEEAKRRAICDDILSQPASAPKTSSSY